jgi:hypothetical protein
MLMEAVHVHDGYSKVGVQSAALIRCQLVAVKADVPCADARASGHADVVKVKRFAFEMP